MFSIQQNNLASQHASVFDNRKSTCYWIMLVMLLPSVFFYLQINIIPQKFRYMRLKNAMQLECCWRRRHHRHRPNKQKTSDKWQLHKKFIYRVKILLPCVRFDTHLRLTVHRFISFHQSQMKYSLVIIHINSFAMIFISLPNKWQISRPFIIFVCARYSHCTTVYIKTLTHTRTS